ncbi:PaaI family thioesterase [Aspergillus foveolatus]|uniref:PaaI family thioesterase n=1 Tax=Aspergillus foveolatus TaxID=210207 RepID=UPI003CCD0E05
MKFQPIYFFGRAPPRLISIGNRHPRSSPQLLLFTTPRPAVRERFHKAYLPPGAQFSSSASALPASQMKPTPSPENIEDLISSLPLIRCLRNCSLSAASPSPSAETSAKYLEFRPFRTMHPSAQVTHLVTTSLISPTKLPIDPIYFLKHSFTKNPSQSPESAEIIATAYLSTHITGHAGYIHGGLIGILFDDVFARLAAEIFPSGVGMTANLTLDFRAPAVPGRVYVWRVGVEKVEKERKVCVYGGMRCLNEFGAEEMRGRGVGDGIPREASQGNTLSVEERDGVLVAEARGLFIEPRGVKNMVPLYPKQASKRV